MHLQLLIGICERLTVNRYHS